MRRLEFWSAVVVRALGCLKRSVVVMIVLCISKMRCKSYRGEGQKKAAV